MHLILKALLHICWPVLPCLQVPVISGRRHLLVPRWRCSHLHIQEVDVQPGHHPPGQYVPCCWQLMCTCQGQASHSRYTQASIQSPGPPTLHVNFSCPTGEPVQHHRNLHPLVGDTAATVDWPCHVQPGRRQTCHLHSQSPVLRKHLAAIGPLCLQHLPQCSLPSHPYQWPLLQHWQQDGDHHLRSPGYCTARPGGCVTCAGIATSAPWCGVCRRDNPFL
jgi:hypothetical protein